MAVFTLGRRIVDVGKRPWGKNNIGKAPPIFDVAAINVVSSPTITASRSFDNSTSAFNMDAANYGQVRSDAALWAQIDFGSTKRIFSVAIQAGPDSSGSHTNTLQVSSDGTTFYTIGTWTGQAYYTTLSPYFDVPEEHQNVRYIRYTKTLSNWARIYRVGVQTDESDL